MPKTKALIMFSLVIALSFSLIGCDMVASLSPEPEAAPEENDEVPGWLLLAHRSDEGPEVDIDDELESIEDEEAEEETSAETAAESPETVSESYEQAQAAPPTQEDTYANAEPKPGSRAYMAWFAANGATGEFDPLMIEWYANYSTNMSYADFLKMKEEEEKSSGGGFTDRKFGDGDGTNHEW